MLICIGDRIRASLLNEKGEDGVHRDQCVVFPCGQPVESTAPSIRMGQHNMGFPYIESVNATCHRHRSTHRHTHC